MTKTEEIFKSNGCPYDNHSQGKDVRVVFCCSAGLLRSPTAARVAGEYGINARSAGSNWHYALIPLTANLIKWAHWVVFLNPQNEFEMTSRIPDASLLEMLRDKSIVWNIEDSYNYMDESLVWVVRKKIEETFEVSLDCSAVSAKQLDKS